MVRLFILLIGCLFFTGLKAQVLSEREQARVVDEILSERINVLLPALMEKNGIDMWVLISREYNEDPVLKTFLPSTWLSARRRTIIVFYNNPAKKQFEKLIVARYNAGNLKSAWDMKRFPVQWAALNHLVDSLKPGKIGINTSSHFGHADGLDHTDYTEWIQTLPAAVKNKIVSAETLAVNWLEYRTEREMQVYPQLIAITHNIIAEGFSEKVITPGVTTTEDLVWWFRQKSTGMGLHTWFHPSVEIQRADEKNTEQQRSFAVRAESQTILPGDLLHVDFGISYLRLNSDIQQMAYVLKPGEKTVPEFLQKAFKDANRLQDILTSQFVKGKTGNEILAAALSIAKKENLVPSIYTHPIGFHGHAAGPTIGLWDMQNGVPGAGDFPLNEHTAYSIELNITVEKTEWNKPIRMMLEENGYFDEKGFRYINGRQKEIYAIPRNKKELGD